MNINGGILFCLQMKHKMCNIVEFIRILKQQVPHLPKQCTEPLQNLSNFTIPAVLLAKVIWICSPNPYKTCPKSIMRRMALPEEENLITT